MAMASLQHLSEIKPSFDIFAKLMGPHLNPGKVIIVPLYTKTSLSTIGNIRTWLYANIPEWAAFEVHGFAKYVGLFLGPSAGSFQWKKQIAQYRNAARQIAATGAPASIACYLYNSKAISHLSYPAQCFRPLETAGMEQSIIDYLLHAPTSAFTRVQVLRMDLYGGPKFQSIHAMTGAALTRCAFSCRALVAKMDA